MTKSEMVKKLAETWGGIPNRQADTYLKDLVEFISKTVKKDKVLKIPDLGTFRLRQMKARIGRNPQTGAKLKIPARKKVGLTQPKGSKKWISGPAKKKNKDRAGAKGLGAGSSTRALSSPSLPTPPPPPPT